MLKNQKEICVKWGDCGPGGNVHFRRYLDYSASCTDALLLRAGLSNPQMLKTYGIAGIPLVELRARVLAPCQFGDTIVAESSGSEWGNTSFVVHHKILTGDVLAAEIFEKHLWVAREEGDSARLKGKAIPQDVKDGLSVSAHDDRD
jgi:4-hydroxybenzoyl-CoA thioesterase